MVKHNLYLIGGLSGVGKSYFGRYMAARRGATFIDQDTYFIKKKPTITLSNGDVVKNWDCIEALDWQKLESDVITLLGIVDVVLVGFALRPDHLKKLWEYDHLFCVVMMYEATSPEEEKLLCGMSRLVAKGVSKARDDLMVEEVVYPFYLDTLKSMSHYITLISFEGGKRRTVEEMYDECELKYLVEYKNWQTKS